MSFNKKYGLALGGVLLALCATGAFLWLKKPAPRQVAVTRAAYHWVSQGLPAGNRALADSLGIGKIYLKMFEVDWQGGLGAQPQDQQYVFLRDLRDRGYANMDRNNKADRALAADPLKGIALVPTVFITNRCLLNLPATEVDTLARKIANRIQVLIPNRNQAPEPLQTPFFNQISEYQIDCDWTEKTRDRYFALLKNLKQRLPGPVSATVRLYQLKYRNKAGVPPVDRGMLMAYNVNPLAKAAKAKTILDIPSLKDYLRGAEPYPLPLDVALPTFGWGLLMRRGRVAGILSKGDVDWAARQKFLKKTDDDRFVSRADTVYESFFLRQGDEIRFEKPTADELLEAARLCAPLSATGNVTVSLFNLTGSLLTDYSHEDLVDTYDAFR